MSRPEDPYGLPPEPRQPAPGAPQRYAGEYPEPQPYHLLLRTSRYVWWRPLAGLVVFLAVFATLAIVLTLATVVAEWVRTGETLDEVMQSFGQDVSPLVLLGTNLSLAAAIPAAALAMVLANRLRPGWLSSVAGHLRWGLLARMAGLALAVIVAFTLVSGFLPAGDGTPDVTEVQVASLSTWLSFAVVVLLTTPLQAAGEEYAFRGYGQQVFGAWFGTPWVGAIVTSLAFAMAHGSQNLPLFLDRFAFGLVACWLVIRTGGLEASIALHAVNNGVLFLLAAAVDGVGSAITVREVPWLLVVVDVVQLVVFALLAVWFVQRRGYQTSSPRAPVAH